MQEKDNVKHLTWSGQDLIIEKKFQNLVGDIRSISF